MNVEIVNETDSMWLDLPIDDYLEASLIMDSYKVSKINVNVNVEFDKCVVKSLHYWNSLSKIFGNLETSIEGLLLIENLDSILKAGWINDPIHIEKIKSNISTYWVDSYTDLAKLKIQNGEYESRRLVKEDIMNVTIVKVVAQELMRSDKIIQGHGFFIGLND